MLVRIRANHVTDGGNGIFLVEIPSVPVAQEDLAALDRLYPNLFHRAEALLAQECLLGAVVDGHVEPAPPANNPPASKMKKPLPPVVDTEDAADRRFGK